MRTTDEAKVNGVKERAADLRNSGVTGRDMVRQLADEFGMSEPSIYRYLRTGTDYSRRRSFRGCCKHCGERMVRGAKYCYSCGKEVTTEGEDICAELSSQMVFLAQLHVPDVDTVNAPIRRAINYIRKLEKEAKKENDCA